jgi:hypothetical protein
MTQQEQYTLIGKLVSEIPEKKTELVCLERKAADISNAFRSVADFVLHASEPLGEFDVKPPRIPEDHSLLDVKQAGTVADNIRKVRSEISKLEEMKRRAGLA